jgi:hypothetical protein
MLSISQVLLAFVRHGKPAFASGIYEISPVYELPGCAKQMPSNL